jgi:Flp pilus assembly protein TadG
MNKKKQALPRRGAVTVEFALTVPLALLLFFGALEFARANMIRNTAQNAAYEGARRAMLPGATASQSEAVALAVLDGIGVRDAEATVDPAVVTNTTPSVTVTIDVPMNSNGYVIANFLRNATIRRSCTLTRERVNGS